MPMNVIKDLVTMARSEDDEDREHDPVEVAVEVHEQVGSSQHVLGGPNGTNSSGLASPLAARARAPLNEQQAKILYRAGNKIIRGRQLSR